MYLLAVRIPWSSLHTSSAPLQSRNILTATTCIECTLTLLCCAHSSLPPCSTIILDISALRRTFALHCPELNLQDDPKDVDSANLMSDVSELFLGLMRCCEAAQVRLMYFTPSADEHVAVVCITATWRKQPSTPSHPPTKCTAAPGAEQ